MIQNPRETQGTGRSFPSGVTHSSSRICGAAGTYVTRFFIPAKWGSRWIPGCFPSVWNARRLDRPPENWENGPVLAEFGTTCPGGGKKGFLGVISALPGAREATEEEPAWEMSQGWMGMG